MPTLNRRNFLQITGAAGLVPVLPAFPAGAATTSTATSAQMLWAGLIAKAGNAQNAANVASAMGVPHHTAQGIFTKLVQNKIVAAHSVGGLSRLAPTASAPSASVASSQNAPSRSFRMNFDQLWSDETTEKEAGLISDEACPLGSPSQQTTFEHSDDGTDKDT